ncbi:MAG TPA: iron-sulfur cluster assembly scaffold protein [Saprospiraceae bacterium]|nr:iron-sulfur cluster assembly scaffold protein [Saprospiraceae bacterium]
MNKQLIERLYKELIIPESIQPYKFEKRDGSHILAYNPICGDKYRIYTGDKMSYYGQGCALSKASGSLMIRHLEKYSFSDAREIIQQFIAAVRTGSAEKIKNSSLSLLVTLKNFDGREDCILLTWLAMYEYLKNK